MELKDQIEDIWAQAEAQITGVIVATDEPQQLMNALIEARLDLQRPALFQFSLHTAVGKVYVIRTNQAVRIDEEYKPLE
jgi:hypothetical protein